MQMQSTDDLLIISMLCTLIWNMFMLVYSHTDSPSCGELYLGGFYATDLLFTSYNQWSPSSDTLVPMPLSLSICVSDSPCFPYHVICFRRAFCIWNMFGACLHHSTTRCMSVAAVKNLTQWNKPAYLLLSCFWSTSFDQSILYICIHTYILNHFPYMLCLRSPTSPPTIQNVAQVVLLKFFNQVKRVPQRLRPPFGLPRRSPRVGIAAANLPPPSNDGNFVMIFFFFFILGR